MDGEGGPESTPPLPDPPARAIEWRGDAWDGVLWILDQTRLPTQEIRTPHRSPLGVIEDVKRLAVRGAPAIGLAGAYALVLAARTYGGGPPEGFADRLAGAADEIASARPTAVNLRTAVDRSLASLGETILDPQAAAEDLFAAARTLEAYEREACAGIARYGAERLEGFRRIATHCNTGSLVTPGLGTALAPLFALHAWGREIHVWVDETRPLLQGLRLTAWELARAGVPHAVLPDGAQASLMRHGKVDAVIVGADRICRNGDVANKVGTYALAVAARHHGVPFFVAAPLSTLDPETPAGDAVSIEDRPGDLRRYLRPGSASPDLATHEPAFDVTPAELVTGLITDEGCVERPDEARLVSLMDSARRLQAGQR